MGLGMRLDAFGAGFRTAAYEPIHTSRYIRADADRPMHTADAYWPKWRAAGVLLIGLQLFRDFLKTCNAVVGGRIEPNRNLKDMISVDRRVCANRGACAGARNARGG